MNIPIIEMDRSAARSAFLEYRDAVRASLDREAETYDERRRQALATRREADEALAMGRQVVDLRRAIAEGGEDDAHRPRLAITRADETGVRMTRNRDGSLRFLGHWQRSDHSDPRTASDLSLPAGTLPVLETLGRWGEITSTAIVPTIPPRFRPGQPERYHILWEAEWGPVAPKDPALLRALGDGLYVVLAVWDLTELERAVLGLRPR